MTDNSDIPSITNSSGYNGFSNWETWQVNLWSDNDYGTYKAKVAMQGNAHPEGSWDADGFHICYNNGFKPWTALKAEAWFRSVYPDGTPDMCNKELAEEKVLVNGNSCASSGKHRLWEDPKMGAACYDLVNWNEIADSWNSP